MSYTDTSVQQRVVNAFFDTSGAAKKAVDDLVAAGVPREHITQTDGATAGEPVVNEATAGEHKGFFEKLEDLFLPDEDRRSYAEGLSRGGYLITVRTEDGNYNRVLDILDQDGAIDMDARENEWRSSGWSSTTSASAATLASGVGASTAAYDTTPARSTSAVRDTIATPAAGVATTTAPAAATSAATTSAAVGKDEVIPLYEEKLNVGKRDVSHGRVRLRSYVVETPVSEQVSLRKETVSIDRRPVDRPVSVGDDVFQERVIEAEERAEEAVISKEARVREEIALRKTADTQVKTVADTVRRTEVDVEDARSGLGTAATTAYSGGFDASKIAEHMDVISADGQKIGKVDHLDGPDRIKLTKNDSPDGQHHVVPFSWIDHVDQHVHLKKTLADIKAQASTL